MLPYLPVVFCLRDELVFGIYTIIFHLQQTFPANTIAECSADISPFFIRQGQAVALALGNIAHFAFKNFVATWAIFIFMNTHV
jgi:hypothetical protein